MKMCCVLLYNSRRSSNNFTTMLRVLISSGATLLFRQLKDRSRLECRLLRTQFEPDSNATQSAICNIDAGLQFKRL